MLRRTKPMQPITTTENWLMKNSKYSGYDICNSAGLIQLNIIIRKIEKWQL